ncbi:MAG: YkgJ family cysteine cluster protein [Nitrospirae bacterium]|nr:YkgJ family cysteine cluster protein [Nitrospirota bacterium]
MEIITSGPIQVNCNRCGECCRKGGPTLHISDAKLLTEGHLSYSDLYTIRSGELVYNNIEDKLINIDFELIKVKELEGQRTCKFFKDQGNECSIYEHRPLQCEKFECWNSEKLMEAFLEDKLTRSILLAGDDSLTIIVNNHEIRCSYETLKELFDDIAEGKDVTQEIFEILQYDADMRPLLAKNLSIKPEYIPLLLGRPLEQTLHMFGFKIEIDIDRNNCLSKIE